MSNLTDLIERARHCRQYGNFDSLHGELLDMVEFLEHEFEAERDRATQHFDKRMDLLARLRAFGRDCVEHGDMTPSGERALMSIHDRYLR